MIHNIAGYLFGTTGALNKIDRIGLWTAVTAAMTFILAIIALWQLGKMNKTSKTDFIHRFTKDFFSPETRRLIMLFDPDYDLLKFEVEKIHDEKSNEDTEYPYFKLDKDGLNKLTKLGKEDKEKIKDVYSAYEVDDDLLGHFEDVGNYEAEGLLDFKMVYNGFDWYITTIWDNKEIQKYIKWERDIDGDDIYKGFEDIYKKLKIYKGE